MILNVKGQELKITNSVISEGTLNYATFEVRCDKSWKKLNKTVRFCHEGSDEIYDVPDVKDGQVCYVPNEVLRQGMVEVGVVGVKGGGTVVTTSKGSFTVMASIDSGKTPRVSRDAYAEYVSTVLRHTEKCKAAQNHTLEAKKETMRAREECETFYTGAKEALAESKEILENVSGALDAVGLALKDIREREEGLHSLDRTLSENERWRMLSEKERSFKDRVRDEREKERERNEKERELSEKGRMTGERVRCYNESERERSFREFDLRLTALEDKSTLYTEEIIFEESAVLRDENILSVILSPKNCMTQNVFSAFINGEEVSIILKSPLIKIGDTADSLVFNKEKTYALRRFYTLTLDGTEEIYEEEREGEETLFVIPFVSEIYPDGNIGSSSYFSYGKEKKGERIWVSGNCLFFALPTSVYKNKSALSEKMSILKKEGTPLKVTFSLSTPTEEKLPFVSFDDEGISVISKECHINVMVAKNIISTLAKLISKIDNLEKIINEKENKNELETKTFIT